MSQPRTIVVDVTAKVGIDGEHRISSWIFPPEVVAGPVPTLFCLAGGSYSKAYWHLEVPGHPGYSFAEYLAARGMFVVAVDHIGTGESSRHPSARDLTPDVVAAANAAALLELQDRATAGRLSPDMAPLQLGPVVGVGHSMGAMLAIFQQSLYGSFDAIAVLGYGTIGPIIDFGRGGFRSSLPSYEEVIQVATADSHDFAAPVERTADMRHHFYWDDVPGEVIAADDLTATSIPGVTGMLSIVPFIASDHARRVTCPVFIGLGERDSSSDHHNEPRAYASSNDVTLYILARSAHCHNTAGTRRALWDRLEGWVRTLSGWRAEQGRQEVGGADPIRLPSL